MLDKRKNKENLVSEITVISQWPSKLKSLKIKFKMFMIFEYKLKEKKKYFIGLKLHSIK